MASDEPLLVILSNGPRFGVDGNRPERARFGQMSGIARLTHFIRLKTESIDRTIQPGHRPNQPCPRSGARGSATGATSHAARPAPPHREPLLLPLHDRAALHRVPLRRARGAQETEAHGGHARGAGAAPQHRISSPAPAATTTIVYAGAPSPPMSYQQVYPVHQLVAVPAGAPYPPPSPSGKDAGYLHGARAAY